MGFFIAKTSNTCGWKCQVTIVWDTLQMGLLQMTASDQKVTVGDCLPANLPVTVILWLSLGKMSHFILGTNTRIWILPCHYSGATVWFRGSHILSWIELLPPISSIFHRRLDFFFCTCDLNHITGNWPTADIRPAVTLIWHHRVIPSPSEVTNPFRSRKSDVSG